MVTVNEHNGYVSFTTNFSEIPWLGGLPLSVEEGIKNYDVSQYIPIDATEILIYIFVTVRNNPGTLRRFVYVVFTEDQQQTRYSQFMNTVFTKNNDFVMNSANIWLPIYSEQKFHIYLPAEWPISPPTRSK